MALFNDLGSLAGLFMQPDKNENKQLANRAGVDTNDFSKIATLALPLLLQGINKNNQSKEGLESFNQALKQHQTRNNYDSLDQFAQNVDTSDGDKIVNHVFSNNQSSTVTSGLADRLGVSPQTVQRTLAVLAPLVLKYLADRKQENNLDAKAIQNETQNATTQVAKQVRKLNASEDNSNGLLGDLLGGLLSNDDSKKDKKDQGLLGDLFNLFK